MKRSKGAAAETWTYGYDHRGQAVWAEQRGTDGGTLQNRVEYRYDAFGNRLQRVQTDGAGAVVADDRFAHDGWNPAKAGAAGTSGFDAWADLSAANAVTTRRLFGDGLDDLAARVSAGGAVAWYLTDLQGSVRQVVDNAAAVVGSRDYAAFGAVTAATGAGLDRYGYTAREWDATLGVQYTRARLYDPTSGRFLGEDPLGLAAGDVNTFRYAGNAVTIATDPSGLSWLSENAGALWNGFAEVPRIFYDVGAAGAAVGRGYATGNWVEPNYHSQTVNNNINRTRPTDGPQYSQGGYFNAGAAGGAVAGPVTGALAAGVGLGNGDTRPASEYIGGGLFIAGPGMIGRAIRPGATLPKAGFVETPIAPGPAFTVQTPIARGPATTVQTPIVRGPATTPTARGACSPQAQAPATPPLLPNRGTSPLGNQGPIANTLETSFRRVGGRYVDSANEVLDGTYKVVVMPDGSIRYAPSWAGTHAEIAGDSQVPAAGEIIFNNGQVVDSSITSGHYKPPTGRGYSSALDQAIRQHGYNGPAVRDGHN